MLRVLEEDVARLPALLRRDPGERVATTPTTEAPAGDVVVAPLVGDPVQLGLF
jgi:hypothetical protein